jgi:hypothetical protein
MADDKIAEMCYHSLVLVLRRTQASCTSHRTAWNPRVMVSMCALIGVGPRRRLVIALHAGLRTGQELMTHRTKPRDTAARTPPAHEGCVRGQQTVPRHCR